MAAGVLVVIPIVVLLAIVLGAAMFWDGVLTGGRHRSLLSRLPLVSGVQLHEWGVGEGRRIAGNWAKAERGPFNGASLSLRANKTIDGLLSQAWNMPRRPAAPVPCNPRLDSDPRVNVPEAMAIVEELNRRSPGDRQEVIEHARNNLALRRRVGAVLPSCPLLLSSGCCACSAARPLACRGRCTAGLDAPPGGEAWARKLGQAIDSGIEEELRVQNLDAGRYDMNEALVTLLEHPAYAERWSRGERLFEKDAADITQ